MLAELLAGLALFAAATLIGLPLLLYAARRAGLARETMPGDVALGLAPALGMAVFAALGPPLFMFVGPSEWWGWPVLAALLVGASVGVWLLAARRRVWDGAERRDVLILAGLLMAALACLAAPALFGGFNRVVFFGNSSDWTTYLTLAETSRTATWQQVREGFQYAVTPPSQALVQENPLALYSARFVGNNARLSTIVDFGWFAEVSGIGVQRLMWAFMLPMGLATLTTAWAASRALGVPRFFAAFGALAVTLGFWAAMPREADAISHVQATPLILAIVALRISDARAGRFCWTTSALVGLLIAAFVQVYSELAPLLLATLAGEALAHALDPKRRLTTLKSSGAALGIALALLVVSGQIFYLAEITFKQLSIISATSAAALGGFYFALQSIENPVASIAGLPWLTDWLRDRLRVPPDSGALISLCLGVATIVGCLFATWRLLGYDRWRAGAILASGAAVGLLIGLRALFGDEPQVYIYQKAMTYTAPFALLLLASAGAAALSAQWIRRVRYGVAAAVGLLLLPQAIYASEALVRDVRGRLPNYLEPYHVGRDYDLAEIRRALNERCPCDLLVYTPPSADWWWASFVAMSVARYAPYYQMGHFYDNRPLSLIFPELTPARPPRYALIDKGVDYIGERGLGQLIVEAGDLRLYEINATDMAAFAPRPLDPEAIRPAPTPPAAVVVPQWEDLEHENERRPVADNAVAEPFPAARVTLRPRRRVVMVLRDIAVEPGDTVQASVRAWSGAPASLTMFVMRHCNQDRPQADVGTGSLETTRQPQVLQATVTFTGPFDCIRVDVYNPSDRTVRVLLTDPEIVHTRAAEAPPPPD